MSDEQEKFEAWNASREKPFSVCKSTDGEGYAFPVARAAWELWQYLRNKR